MSILFIGLLGKNPKTSVEIRNKWLIEENIPDKKILFDLDDSKIRNGIKFAVSIFYVLLYGFKYKNIHISTNPKFLSFLALIHPSKTILNLGDPLEGDSSRNSTSVHKVLAHLLKIRSTKIVVFSPFLVDRLIKNGYKHVIFKMRPSLDFSKLKLRLRLNRNKASKAILSLLHPGDLNGSRSISPFEGGLVDGTLCITIYGECDVNSKYINIKKKIPIQSLVDTLQEYDAIIISLNPTGEQVPGKFFDFSQSPIPVIVYGRKEHVEYLSDHFDFPNYIYLTGSNQFNSSQFKDKI